MKWQLQCALIRAFLFSLRQVRQGRLDRGFSGVGDCVTRVLRNEGILAFWRGNLASVIRYFPQQALNFAFKVRWRRRLIFARKLAVNLPLCRRAGSVISTVGCLAKSSVQK